MASRLPRVRRVLGKLWIPLIVLAATATTAIACLSPAPTTLTTSLSGGGKEGEEITVSEGTGVKDTATLKGENAGKATGTVKYTVYSDSKCKKLVTKAGEVTVKEGKVPASEEEKLEAGATYYWLAEYGGDSLDKPSTSTCGKEVLNVKAKTSLTTTLSGGGKEGEEIVVAGGSKVKDTATLSGTDVSSATGTVDYAVYKDEECKELVTEAGKGKVEGSKAASSEEKELKAGAIYFWQAEYSGDSLHEKSTSECGAEVLTVTSTLLCDIETGPLCVQEEIYPKGTEITAALAEETEAQFSTSLGTIGCKKSTLEAKTGETGTESLSGELTSLTFLECKLSSTSCELKAESLPYTTGLVYTEDGDGELTVGTTKEGTPSIGVSCPKLVECTFEGAEVFNFGGGEPGLLETSTKVAQKGLLCPKEAEFAATYELSAPEDAFVAQQPARRPTLCEAAPVNRACPAGKAYSGETISELEAGQSETFVSTVGATGTVTCTQVKMIGKFQSSGISQNPGGIDPFDHETNNPTCTSTLAAPVVNPAVTVEMVRLPYDASVIAYNGPDAPQGIMGFGPGTATHRVSMLVTIDPTPGANIRCSYRKDGEGPFGQGHLTGEISNPAGAESKITIDGKWLVLSEWPRAVPPAPAICPTRLVQIARLKFLRPGAQPNIYITAP